MIKTIIFIALIALASSAPRPNPHPGLIDGLFNLGFGSNPLAFLGLGGNGVNGGYGGYGGYGGHPYGYGGYGGYGGGFPFLGGGRGPY